MYSTPPTNLNRGFTLIELLVVIAIIGTLASVVLASLNSARDKANQSAIQAQMEELHKAAELYHLSHGGYGTTNRNDDDANACAGHTVMNNTMFGQNAADDSVVKIVEAVNQKTNSRRFFCVVRPGTDSWAAAAYLEDTGTRAWCVDSSGSSKKTTVQNNQNGDNSLITSGVAICP